MTALAEHVDQAAEHLRAANHATVRAAVTATETYAVVGNLHELVRRLPQLLDFLTRALRRADAAGYFDDRGTYPATALHCAHDHLDGVRHHTTEMAGHLTEAHNQLGHLGRLVPED